MKVMKTLKTLKFWSKKKKKKKNINHHIHHHPPPPCCCRHHHDGIHIVQPSAPPLPSWIDYEEQTYNQHLLATSEAKFSELPISYESQFDPQDNDDDRDMVGNAPTEPDVANPSSSSSYQKYMVENPVYGVPVLTSRKTERYGGAFGCVFNVGAHLFRCFFPCFHIREV